MNKFRPSQPSDIPQLRRLWKACFADTDRFLDLFFSTAYAPRRSIVLTEQSSIWGAAYWFDCAMKSRKLAYVYAVSISPDQQGNGLGSALMTAIHNTLARQGYSIALLVPGDEGLRRYYERFGYRTCSHRPLNVSLPPLTPVSPEEYARARIYLLPENGVLQEGENLAFLSGLADFYRSGSTIAALSREDGSCLELLGCPWEGETAPFAMGLSLTNEPLPEEVYFAFGFQ